MAPDPRFQIDRRRRWTVTENYIASDGGWATAFREPTDEEWQSIAAAERARILAALPEALRIVDNDLETDHTLETYEKWAAALAAAIERVLGKEK